MRNPPIPQNRSINLNSFGGRFLKCVFSGSRGSPDGASTLTEPSSEENCIDAQMRVANEITDLAVFLHCRSSIRPSPRYLPRMLWMNCHPPRDARAGTLV